MHRLNFKCINLKKLTTPKNSNKVRINWFFVVNENNDAIRTQCGYLAHEFKYVAEKMMEIPEETFGKLKVIQVPVVYF
ncbi:hypothetical protein A9G48_04325 [Gilliamella sp. wkB18]|nr:hypothetical protein A9G48_04325 [Gilliamella apicola]